MALSDILTRLKSEINVPLSTAEQRTWLLRVINRAAEQIWRSNDLVLALREQYIELPTDNSQVALPYYVGQLRGVRRPSIDPRDPIRLHDMRPRYHYNSWGDMGINTFRIKQETPLAQSISSATPLTATIVEPQSTAVSIVISGSSNAAAVTSETLVIPAGSLSATATKVFVDYKTISKSARTTCDVTMTDAAGNVVSVIPNMLDKARYLLINVQEAGCFVYLAVSTCFCIELLYKPFFIPFYNDEDTFGCEGYDNEITDGTMALLEKDPAKRADLLQLVNTNIANKMDEFMRGQQVPMNMAPDPWIRSYENIFENRVNYGINPRR